MTPEETHNPPRKRNYFVWIGLVGLLVATVLFVTRPMVNHCRKNFDHTQAVNNARQIGLALNEFEHSYGVYPNDSTPNVVQGGTGSMLTLGTTSSNDYFRQLIAAEITQSEDMFYANIPHGRKPDNQIKGNQALEKGECGFAYLAGATKDSQPETPLAITPLLPGKSLFDYECTKKTFSGKSVVLRYDGSVHSHSINKSGHALINGKDLFDPTQPFWNGNAPTIKWPDL